MSQLLNAFGTLMYMGMVWSKKVTRGATGQGPVQKSNKHGPWTTLNRQGCPVQKRGSERLSRCLDILKFMKISQKRNFEALEEIRLIVKYDQPKYLPYSLMMRIKLFRWIYAAAEIRLSTILTKSENVGKSIRRNRSLTSAQVLPEKSEKRGSQFLQNRILDMQRFCQKFRKNH